MCVIRDLISKYKKAFEKGHQPNWSAEVFIIVERIARQPLVYRLKDQNEEPIEGTFYEHEIQRIDKTDKVYKIEKVLKRRRGRGGRREIFVK